MVQVDSAFKTDLDRQIASVMDCNPLLEEEVIRLCEKVGFAFEFQIFSLPQLTTLTTLFQDPFSLILL
jgi:hypothetical protein